MSASVDLQPPSFATRAGKAPERRSRLEPAVLQALRGNTSRVPPRVQRDLPLQFPGRQRRRAARRLRGPARRGSREKAPEATRGTQRADLSAGVPRFPVGSATSLDVRPRREFIKDVRASPQARRRARLAEQTAAEREGLRRRARGQDVDTSMPQWQKQSGSALLGLDREYFLRNVEEIWKRARDIYSEKPPTLAQTRKYAFAEPLYWTQGDENKLRAWLEAQEEQSRIEPAALLRFVHDNFAYPDGDGARDDWWGELATCETDVYCASRIMRNLLFTAAYTIESALSVQAIEAVRDATPIWQRDAQQTLQSYGTAPGVELITLAAPATLAVLELLTLQTPVGRFNGLLELDWNDLAAALQSFGDFISKRGVAARCKRDTDGLLRCDYSVDDLYAFFRRYLTWRAIVAQLPSELAPAVMSTDYARHDWRDQGLELCKRIARARDDPRIGLAATKWLRDNCNGDAAVQELNEKMLAYERENFTCDRVAVEELYRCTAILLTAAFATQFPSVRQQRLRTLPELGVDTPTSAAEEDAEDTKAPSELEAMAIDDLPPASSELPSYDETVEACALFVFAENNVVDQETADAAIAQQRGRGNDAIAEVIENCARLARGDRDLNSQQIRDIVSYGEYLREQTVADVGSAVAPLEAPLEAAVVEQCANRILYEANVWSGEDLNRVLPRLRAEQQPEIPDAVEACVEYFRGNSITRAQAENIVRIGEQLAPSYDDKRLCDNYFNSQGISEASLEDALRDNRWSDDERALLERCGLTLSMGMPLRRDDREQLTRWNASRASAGLGQVF